MTAAIDPAIAAFLADGGYANVEEWMEDSDCYWNDGAWWQRTYGDEAKEGDEMDPIGTIEGAMEACGWDRPHDRPHDRPDDRRRRPS